MKFSFKELMSVLEKQTGCIINEVKEIEPDFIGEKLFSISINNLQKLLHDLGINEKFTFSKMIGRITPIDYAEDDYEFALYLTELDNSRINGFWNIEQNKWHITVSHY